MRFNGKTYVTDSGWFDRMQEHRSYDRPSNHIFVCGAIATSPLECTVQCLSTILAESQDRVLEVVESLIRHGELYEVQMVIRSKAPPLSAQTLRNVCAAKVVVDRVKSGEDTAVSTPVMEYHVQVVFIGCEDDPKATFGPFSKLDLAEKCCITLAARPIFSARITGKNVA